MSTAFDTFDKSPLDAFVKSALDARNAPGGTLFFYCSSSGPNVTEENLRNYITDLTGYPSDSYDLIFNDAQKISTVELFSYSTVVYIGYGSNWLVPSIERVASIPGRFVMQTWHVPAWEHYAAQFNGLSSLTGLRCGRHGPGATTYEFVSAAQPNSLLMDGIDGFYIGVLDVFGCTGGIQFLQQVSTLRASADSKFVLIADAFFTSYANDPRQPGYPYRDRIRRLYQNIREMPLGA